MVHEASKLKCLVCGVELIEMAGKTAKSKCFSSPYHPETVKVLFASSVFGREQLQVVKLPASGMLFDFEE